MAKKLQIWHKKAPKKLKKHESDEGKLRKDLETGVKSGWDFLKGKVTELKDSAAAATAKNGKAAADERALIKVKAEAKKLIRRLDADQWRGLIYVSCSG